MKKMNYWKKTWKKKGENNTKEIKGKSFIFKKKLESE